MKKFCTGMLVLTLLLSFTGCSTETSTSTDASSSNLIYETTISPNEKYITKESDQVLYTIQVYQEKNGVKVASSSNSAFSQAMSYQVETSEPITKEDITVQWQTLTGSTEDSKGDQFAVADVTISVQGKVISERKVSFIGKALDIDEYGADYGDCFLCAHRQTSRPRWAELSGLLYYSPFRLSSGAFPSENLLLFQKNA